MKKQEIIEKLEAGEYEIRHDEDCGCNISWDIVDDTLAVDVDGDCCYEGNTLVVDGEDVCSYIRYEGLQMCSKDIDRDDIDENIISKLRMGETKEQGESGNCETHDDNVRESLVDWLMDCGYILDRDDDRGFANEYTMILREVAEGETAPEITREQAEEWADAYLYDGDPATQAFNGFRLESAEEEAEEIEN